MRGRITRGADRGNSELEAVERNAVPRRSGPSLTLAVAMPKGPRGTGWWRNARNWCIAAVAAELQGHRSNLGAGKVSRWRRKAIEAAKQSGQSTTMDVEAQTSLTELFETRL